jgi:hypothetical protein
MQSTAAEGFSGLLQWSDPIIYDRLREVYAGRLADHDSARRLARLHARVWRSLLRGDLAEFDSLRAALVAALDEHDVDLDCLADADARTMKELVEIVVVRFQRSPRVSMQYHLALLELAGRLAPANAHLPMAA